MSLAIRLVPEVVRSLNGGLIGDTYMGVGSAMTKPIRIILLQNLTNISVMFSFDGIHDHLPLPINGYLVLDITSNKTIPQGFFISQGQRIYVKKLTSTDVGSSLGAVYLSTFYGAEI